LVCAVTVSATMLGGMAAVSADPPPNPSDGQLQNSKIVKDRMADKVGQLSALVTQAQSQLQVLKGKAEQAEQKYALALQQLQQAKDAAAKAQADVEAAQKAIEAARVNLAAFVRSSYMAPSVNSGPVGLFTASDPNALLQSGDYVQFLSDRHLEVVTALDKATVEKSNAEAKAKAAVISQQNLTEQADQAQQNAKNAYAAEQQQSAQLAAQQQSYQTQLAAAKAQLASLNGQRAAYNAWQEEQARIAAQKAAEEAAQRAAAALAAQEAAQNYGGGGGGQVNTPLPAAGSMGGWTAAKGQAAVNRAMSQLGVPYAWAGGNYNGPTYGVNSPGTDGWNDSSVYGFDCSGLVLYAWAPQGLYMAHYAATQYTQAGSFHPSPGQFQPGDLLFWSYGGISGIHHVAMYIGNGNVIQAPYSGTVVQVTPWNQVASGFFGATRPLT